MLQFLAECKKPWLRADWPGNCYLLGTEKMTYDEAQQVRIINL